MGRNLVPQWRLLRRVLHDGRLRTPFYRNYSTFSRSGTNLGSSSSPSSSLSKFLFSSSSSSLRHAPDFFFPSVPFHHCRSLCSASDPSNIILIKSENLLKESLSKAREEALPAIFYFTAAWCGPCRLLAPVIKELSKNYPEVTTYKIDIDQEGLERTLNDLNITSVPTLYFFQDGKEAGQIVGADVAGIKNMMEKIYKK
ncbi:thioredoxin O2, mitochondrial-like [Cucumis melo]|uniref:Thioredoxin O2, mitochondrial-like n=1 Tax=Cucumis melo TaxID=3656 RepID=A0A1S3AYT8_CUCME|nr:thioredoxin O2, mitochondrial-like [Cucumis melo]XP_050944460.1 thioredoxin O2, mitochondrial-like [Cucumis melo]